MTDLLRALDWRASAGGEIFLVAGMTFVTLSILAIGAAFAKAVGLSTIFLQCAIWVLWLTWLGVVFPRNRRRDEAVPCSYPYRRAFLREILPGVAVAFSQLLRPALSGLMADGRDLPLAASAAIGLPLLVAGAGIVALGVSALGVARTLFLYEYIPTDRPVTVVGIFQVLRHPLFLGGSMFSLGLAMCTGAQIAVELGLINACVIPIYVQLEDRRCCAALGSPYMHYRSIVGGVIPRRHSAISRSALAPHASGNIVPTTPRNLVKTP
jgi:protein-S-isoprenylcysteine O-methyltransferase Ste14